MAITMGLIICGSLLEKDWFGCRACWRYSRYAVAALLEADEMLKLVRSKQCEPGLESTEILAEPVDGVRAPPTLEPFIGRLAPGLGGLFPSHSFDFARELSRHIPGILTNHFVKGWYFRVLNSALLEVGSELKTSKSAEGLMLFENWVP